MARVREIVTQIADGLSTERQKATALHDYVRDAIKFGFNRYFDLSSPERTLALGVAHCNPKTELMMALFREAGLEAYPHFVVLPNEVVRGVVSPDRYWLVPRGLSHSYTEVRVEGTWCSIDSYLLDSRLFKAARAKLAEEGLTVGYATHVQSTNQWDGKSHAFSVFLREMMLEDHGRIESFETYYQSDRYRNKAFGMRLNTIFRFLGKSLEAQSRLYLDKLREHYMI